MIGPWKVLHPAADDHFAQGSHSALVLQGHVRGFRILLLSNLGRLGQRALLEREPELKTDILIASTPARREDQLSEFLLQRAQPQLIIMAGSDFPASARPSRELRERLESQGVPVVYTSDSGAATLMIDGGGWKLTTMDPQVSFAAKQSSTR
jgi:beta-lactamase superfamily II metal-dependent hydrolase